MDFAKKLMNKYGWKEGDGLGKNNDGIAKPLKAHMKFDNTGLGSDRATEFNDHWWERCYNEASGNLKVNTAEDGKIQMDVKDAENGVEITTKSYSVNKLKKAKNDSKDNNVEYGNFLYSSTLTNTGETLSNPFKVSLDDIALRSVKILSDDELFKACGGLTAHKGARHGLKLSGKLKRLQQQEEELLAKMKNGMQPFQSDVQKKPKKEKRKKESSENQDLDASTQSLNDSQSVLTDDIPKKRKKKDNVVEEKMETNDMQSNEEVKKIKKKKNSKHSEIKTEDTTAEKPEDKDGHGSISSEKVKQKKKKKSKS